MPPQRLPQRPRERQRILHRFYFWRSSYSVCNNFFCCSLHCFWIAFLSYCWRLKRLGLMLLLPLLPFQRVHIPSISVLLFYARFHACTSVYRSHANTHATSNWAQNRHFPWTDFYDNLFLCARMFLAVSVSNGNGKQKKNSSEFSAVSTRTYTHSQSLAPEPLYDVAKRCSGSLSAISSASNPGFSRVKTKAALEKKSRKD